MHNFIFENGTRLIFGAGCLKEYLASFLERYGPNVLLVTDGSGEGARCGAQDEVSRLLRTGGKTAVECRVRPPCPSSKEARQAARLCREHHVDLILGVGGSAVLDCCKAASLASVCRGDLWEDFWASRGVVDLPPLPVGLVSTAVEVGAVNGAAGLIRNGRCVWQDYPPCDPGFALLDPAYTLTLPRMQVLSGAFDTLSHAMETYFGRSDRDNVSDEVAEAVMRSTVTNMRTLLGDLNDYTARSNLMWTSAMAENGILKVGRLTDFECHQIEHQLGAYTDCNHGQGLAVIHPAYYRHIYKSAVPKFARFARNVWGIDPAGKTEEEAAQAGILALEAFILECGLPTKLSQLRSRAEITPALLQQVADSCNLLPNGYKQLTHDEVYDILMECL